jgi:SecD/SecF fusion protein
MPLPSENVAAARRSYEQQLEAIAAANVMRSEVLGVIKADPAIRDAAMAALERGVSGRVALLKAAADAQQASDAAREAYEAVKADAEKSIAAVEKAAEAERALDQAIAAVMATNIDPDEIGLLLSLDRQPQLDPQRQPIPNSSKRDKALAQMLASNAARSEQVRSIVKASDDYDQVKGRLDDPNDLIRLLRGSGMLEFRIAADPSEVPSFQEMRRQLEEKGPRAIAAGSNLKWYVVDKPQGWLQNAVDNEYTMLRRQGTPRPRSEIERELEALQRDDPSAFYNRYGGGMLAAGHGRDAFFLLWDTEDKSLTARKQGWQLTRAIQDMDQRTGRPAVAFQLNELGGSYMNALTGANVNRKMAILLDGRVYSAPNIQSQIGASGQITGDFTDAELRYLIRTLNAGSLKARLSEEPISIRNVGPSLGRDNLERGMESIYIALAAVTVWMTSYYFFGGLVASAAILANVLIILASMAFLRGNFTLPGIAGIVLTIGMCVDANVLIYERIREELLRGANMLTALRLGYQRALSAIVDGNLTTLIICIVLYYTCTADIAGFGLTLGIGIAATLFASLFMTQVFFVTWFHRLGVKRRLSFLPLAVPAIGRLLEPKIDWISRRWLFYGVSGALMAISLALVASRGSDLLDVEFRGGTEVSFDLKKGQTLSLQQARDRLAKTTLSDTTVVAIGNVDAEFRAGSFSVITGESDRAKVEAVVKQTFQDVLEIPPVIAFGSAGAELKNAPVFPVTSADLAAVIQRPGAREASHNLTDYLGGAAIVLEGMKPAASLEAVRARLKVMRFQPEYESQQFRRVNVVGLTPDSADPSLFTAVAVVVAPDKGGSYFEDRGAWDQMAAVEWKLVGDAMSRQTSLSKVSSFTPTVAITMVNRALVAIVISSLAIILYVWIRFGSVRWGLGAVLALIHDLVIAMGVLAACGYFYDTSLGRLLLIDPFKINMTIVAAFLTIIGYSINDTIVVYDRIRENKGKLPRPTIKIMNDAVNQTMSRTFLTGGTSIIALMILYVLGGEAIRGFALCMLVGIITGTYSSWGIAAPLLLIGTPEAKALVKPVPEPMPA